MEAIKPFTKALVIIVIAIHLMFFLLEAIFWMEPLVNEPLINLLNNKISSGYVTQAITLKNLFINQGCYNLFLALAGIAGLFLTGRKQRVAGYTLILFLCFAGTGAGIVLALSTNAYLFAFIQGAPAAVTFYRILPLYQRAV